LSDPSSTPSVLSRRHFGQLAAAGAALIGFAPSADAADTSLSRVTLRMADYKAQDALLLKTAKLDDMPYRLSVSEFPSGQAILEAINAGAVDLGSMSETPPAFGAAAQADFRIVGVVHDDVNWQVVLVPKGSALRTVADLRGKRVGYVRATTTQYYLARMLARAGLSFTDIQATPLGVSEGQAAFDRGSLDAWAIYGYSVPLAIRDGARVLVTANGYLSGNYLYAASPAALTDPGRSAAMADFFVRMRRAYAWRAANIGAWAAVHSAAIRVPVEIDIDMLTHASAPRDLRPITDSDVVSAQDVADLFGSLGVLPRRVDMAAHFDRRFNAVLAEPPT
jgi:sulfonate transport system substrate-binding protein